MPLFGHYSMIRTGKDKELKEWFDRVRIATLTFSQRQVTIISEMLSRLCFRFSIGQLDQLFKLTLDMYKLPIFRQQYNLHGCVNNLFERVLYAMPQPDLLQKIPELLSLPIPTENGFEVSKPQMWSEPFTYIEWLEDTIIDPDFDRSAWFAPIAKIQVFLLILASTTLYFSTFQRLKQGWLKKTSADIFFQEIFLGLCNALSPPMENNPSQMEQSGLCVLSALSMTLFIDSNSYDEIARKLRYGLNSVKEEEVHGSAFGIFRWLV